MKKAWRILFLLAFIWQPLFAQQNDIPILDRKVNIDIDNESIATLFDILSQKANVFFSYDPVFINADKKITLKTEDKTIREVLDLVFGQKINYEVLFDQIIISKPDKVSNRIRNVKKNVSEPEHISFYGKIIDASCELVLPYVSISIEGKPIGTLSNSEGNFEFKIPFEYKTDTLVISSIGYKKQRIAVTEIQPDTMIIRMEPISIQIKEVHVSGIDPMELMNRLIDGIPQNYAEKPVLMTSFYRETLRQDKTYINITEAVIEILKASYEDQIKSDRIRLLKGRKSPEVKPFKWVNFKMQGGPYYINKLDVIKTMESFINPKFRNLYVFELEKLIDYSDRLTYIIKFKPKEKINYPCFEGELYIDKETSALVRAEFSLGKFGLKYARETMILKKPKGFNVRPLDVFYTVNYKLMDGTWYLHNAQTSAKFRVRSKNDKINSIFHSVSDLLVTNLKVAEDSDQFPRKERFSPRDIFSESITSFDEEFWENYNIIQPDEDLEKAIKKINNNGSSSFNTTNKEVLTTK